MDTPNIPENFTLGSTGNKSLQTETLFHDVAQLKDGVAKLIEAVKAIADAIQALTEAQIETLTEKRSFTVRVTP